jgi:hypothetical protein
MTELAEPEVSAQDAGGADATVDTHVGPRRPWARASLRRAARRHVLTVRVRAPSSRPTPRPIQPRFPRVGPLSKTTDGNHLSTVAAQLACGAADDSTIAHATSPRGASRRSFPAARSSAAHAARCASRRLARSKRRAGAAASSSRARSPTDPCRLWSPILLRTAASFVKSAQPPLAPSPRAGAATAGCRCSSVDSYTTAAHSPTPRARLRRTRPRIQSPTCASRQYGRRGKWRFISALATGSAEWLRKLQGSRGDRTTASSSPRGGVASRDTLASNQFIPTRLQDLFSELRLANARHSLRPVTTVAKDTR